VIEVTKTISHPAPFIRDKKKKGLQRGGQAKVRSLLTPEQQLVHQAIKNPVLGMRSFVKKSLFDFIRYFWSEYSQETFEPNWHINYICEQCEKVIRRVAQNKPKKHDLVINVPPGSTKTAIVSIFLPIWTWVNWLDIKFITGSYTMPLSLESAEYSRDIIRSERFQEMFPEIGIKEDKDTKSNFRVIRREQHVIGKVPRIITGGNRFSTSVAGTVTGYHGHVLIVDDPIDPQRAVSETEVKKANYWMDNTLPFRKVNKEVSVTIVIMQRLHQSDPTGHWLKKRMKKKNPRLKHICIPGEINNYRDMVKPKHLIKNYSPEGLLDPKRLSQKALDDFLDLGQFTYGGQIGQNPIPLGGGMFKTDNISIVERPPDPILVTDIIRYWDKAGTQGAGAYTVGVKMLKTVSGHIYVTDLKRGQWASEEREKIIKQTAEADGVDCKVYVEQEPGSGGLESADATLKNLSGFSCYKDRPVGDKTLRADPYSVQVNLGMVRMLSAKWNDDYIEELSNFPNSTYKDQTDASSGCFAKLSNKKRAKVGRRNRDN
jgi:predicted phage terminase large subunit-like protein